jgi:gamma-glutamyltranspeptidase/glutathione hydrolase/leukotriene-C4 hydrolase
VVSSIALAVTLVFALEGNFDNHEDFSIYDTPLVGPTIAEKYEFLEKLPKSKLGIYPKGGAAVATDTRPCAHMGTNIFRKNGTVVDAAIAVLVCNGAVHSHSLGFGGGFFMTLFINGSSYFLNAREKAPSAATKTMFIENPQSSTEGPLAIAIPAELKGYVEAKERFGNPDISLLELFQPTIDLCENGFKVTR